MKKIAIIGCGYIGFNLIKYFFHKKGYSITAITHDITHLKQINRLSQKSFILKTIEKEAFIPIIQENDYIILTISKNLHYIYEDFLKIANSIKKASISINLSSNLIYTSRATIYGDQRGLWVDENSKPNPLSDEHKILTETENILLSLKKLGWKVTILRLAEVYGPSFELSKKIKLRSDYFDSKTKDYYTNMIHLRDIINSIIFILDHNIEGIYNLADEDHPTQEALLKDLSTKLNIPITPYKLKCIKSLRGNYRVSNNKIKSLGYKFLFPNRIFS
ncbi:MAG: hypothetical protein AMS24_02750 [Chlamydiae bacterium SM23_39]|nr:MAG: hypothetical protein AMS24_02750 [Chlamydiae bacterium SM23_39]